MRILWTIPVVATAALLFAQHGQHAPQHKPGAQHQERKMDRFEVIVESRLGFAETVDAIKKAAEAEKFSIQGVHEISEVLKSKGFERERLTIVEVCNAKQASEALKQDVRMGLMIPCPVMVYEEHGKVKVATFDGHKMASMYEGAKMPTIGAEVGDSLRRIIHAVQ